MIHLKCISLAVENSIIISCIFISSASFQGLFNLWPLVTGMSNKISNVSQHSRLNNNICKNKTCPIAPSQNSPNENIDENRSSENSDKRFCITWIYSSNCKQLKYINRTLWIKLMIQITSYSRLAITCQQNWCERGNNGIRKLNSTCT